MSAEEILKCDERIHCIFYFFSAHGIKENDIDFLSHFSGIVPIIPVVAKADTMTLSERNAFLYQMNQAIRRLSEAAGSSVVYDFSSENNFEVVSSPSKSVEIENGHMNQLEAPQSQRSSIYGAGSMETMGDSNLNRSETESDPISTIKRKTSGLPVPMTLSAKADRGIALAASGFMIHNTQCRPSPEFIALFPHVDDFDASTTSTLFDESRPLERRDSLCSLDSNEELNDSSHSHTLSNRDRSNKFSPTISPNNDQSQGSYYAETSHVTDRAEFANMQRSGSDMERGDSDLDNLFDQETFVNVGKALSNNTHEHFDFGRISGDSDYEGTSVNNMMESAVFVSVITESYSHEDYETERSLPPEHHNTPVSTCTYDDSNTLVSTAEMMEVKLPGALICKLVTHEVCDLIVNPGEKAACRIVSKIVCEHFVPQNSKIDDEVDDSGNINLAAQSNGEFPGDNRGGSECTSMDTDRMDQVAQVAKDNVSICTKRVPHPCIGSYFQRNTENHEGVYEVNALMAGEDPNVGLVLHCDTEANDNTGLRMKRIDGDLGSRIPDSDTITMDSNGVHSNPNIFAIICKESQSDGGVAFGFSDVTRLQYLLFEGT